MTGWRQSNARIGVALTAGLLIAATAFVPGFSHEQDEQFGGLAGAGAGPARDAAVVMPARLVGLEIALGLKGGEREVYEGEVRVSEGRVLTVEVVRGTGEGDPEGGHFQAEPGHTCRAKAGHDRMQRVERRTEHRIHGVHTPINLIGRCKRGDPLAQTTDGLATREAV